MSETTIETRIAVESVIAPEAAPPSTYLLQIGSLGLRFFQQFAEVGRRLFYSERTVKNIVHDVTSRLNLKNRTQAVAYALRQGLI